MIEGIFSIRRWRGGGWAEEEGFVHICLLNLI